MLNGKNIVVGVTGGIAAYKTATLVRLLVKAGAGVKVVMTPLAKEFITPLTMATLSGNRVLADFFDPESGDWNSHVDLGLWADLFVIAPATANTIAKMANGVADNLLLTTYLSARCPVVVAPAMDLDMLKHPATVANLERIKGYGNHIIEPSSGELASGLEGKGRMAEPEQIAKELELICQKKKEIDLTGIRMVINAGPTREPLDPVRFLSNHSSGKMGEALARAAAICGADVDLVLGPVSERPKGGPFRIRDVVTAKEMHDLCVELFEKADVAILAAAVADYTPETLSASKIKSDGDDLRLNLKPTDDIAAALGSMKRPDQIVAGFALETDNEIENARNKLKSKRLDFIVLNSLKDSGAGFGTDTNRITIIDHKDKRDMFELKPKSEVAFDILQKTVSVIRERRE